MAQPTIEFDSAARLTALRRIADDANHVSRDRARQARDLAANLNQARQRLAELQDVRPGFVVRPPSQPAAGSQVLRSAPDMDHTAPHRTWHPDDLAAAITAAEARVRDLEASLDRAKLEADDAQGRWTAAQRLFQNCLDFAKAHDLPLPAPIHQVGADRLAGAVVHGEVR